MKGIFSNIIQTFKNMANKVQKFMKEVKEMKKQNLIDDMIKKLEVLKTADLDDYDLDELSLASDSIDIVYDSNT